MPKAQYMEKAERNYRQALGNWGVLVDNSNNRAKCLHKLMDFNQAFHL